MSVGKQIPVLLSVKVGTNGTTWIVRNSMLVAVMDFTAKASMGVTKKFLSAFFYSGPDGGRLQILN